MGFIESYKHLEKLCGEVLNNDRRISAYIDEMINTPRGAYLVRGWDNDLKQLKHYRWVRNKIAHEPDCTEQNMCEPSDAEWLDVFYSRIMNQTDPLTLYTKATKPRSTEKSTQVHKAEISTYSYPQQEANHKKSLRKAVGCLTFLVGIVFIVAAIILISKLF